MVIQLIIEKTNEYKYRIECEYYKVEEAREIIK